MIKRALFSFNTQSSFESNCTDPGQQLGDAAPLISLLLWTY